jgi:hypothetical protein
MLNLTAKAADRARIHAGVATVAAIFNQNLHFLVVVKHIINIFSSPEEASMLANI